MKNLSRSSYIISVAILFTIFVWFGSGFLFPSNTQEANGKKKETKAFSVQVKSSDAERHTLSLELNGKTEAGRQVTIRTETDGTVEKLYVEEGRQVKEGQKLISLKPDDRKERLQSAKALLQQKKLEYTAAKNLAKKNYKSKTALAKSLAELEKAKADLKKAEVDLENSVITAPFNGILNKYNVEVGDIVSEFSNTPLANFVELDPLLIVVHVEEKHYKNLEKGKDVDIVLSDDSKASGVISYISTVADPNTHTFRVEIKIDNSAFEIPAGVSASVKLPLKESMAHKIPSSCLTLSDDGLYGIKAVNDMNVVEFYPASLVESSSECLWIAGLPDRIRVITVGHEFVKEGATVIPSEANG
jgi:multidrug efflux system membrane fusion protein